jgi:ankyrin repeat protein
VTRVKKEIYDLYKKALAGNLKVVNGDLLLNFISLGDKAAVEVMLSEGVSPNYKNSNTEDTALIRAIESGNEVIIDLLFEKGADVSLPGAYGKTSLMVACSKGDLETVKKLLLRGADVNYVRSSRYGNDVAMNYAAASGKIELMELLLEKGAELNPFPIEDNPIIDAERNNQITAVKWLLNKGAKVNTLNKNGGSVLMNAIVNEHVECIYMLIEAGADINIRDKNGNTAVILAKVQELREIKEYLIKLGADTTGLEEAYSDKIKGYRVKEDALFRGYRDVIHSILKSKIKPLWIKRVLSKRELKKRRFKNVKSIPSDNYKFFLEALQADDIGIIKALKEDKQVNLEEPTYGVEELLSLAIKKGKRELVKLFVSLGANIVNYKEKKYDALNLALELGEEDVIKCLFQGIIVDIADNLGMIQEDFGYDTYESLMFFMLAPVREEYDSFKNCKDEAGSLICSVEVCINDSFVEENERFFKALYECFGAFGLTVFLKQGDFHFETSLDTLYAYEIGIYKKRDDFDIVKNKFDYDFVK